MERSRAVVRLVAAMALVLASASAEAQDVPRGSVSGGYQLIRVDGLTFGTGFYGDAAVNAGSVLAVVGQVAGSFKSESQTEFVSGTTITAKAEFALHSFLGGVRAAVRPHPRVTPFVQVLAGMVRGTLTLSGTGTSGGRTVTVDESESSTDFGLQAGGGVQFLLGARVGVQVGADLITVSSDGGSSSGVRVGAGIVLPF